MLKINGVRLTDYTNDIGKLLACFAADDLSGAEKVDGEPYINSREVTKMQKGYDHGHIP